MIASLTKTKPFLINTPQKQSILFNGEILDIKIKNWNILKGLSIFIINNDKFKMSENISNKTKDNDDNDLISKMENLK